MDRQHDLVVRGGTVIDGSGGEPFEADIAVSGGRIVAIGAVPASGREEIDARGLIVTPGYIDLHTHLDGHVAWESRLYPVTGHGITTAVIGNCGVGFAPCRSEDRETLIHLMETVEDIGFDDLSVGLSWDWESFPDYLAALGRRSYNMDVGALLPHSPARAFVMGERSLSERADDDERQAMANLVREAVAAGALGIGSSTLREQRTHDGRHIPSVLADEAEFTALACAMRDGGGGVFQVAIEFNRFPLACEELEMFRRVGEASGQPILFSCKQTNTFPEGWRELLAISDRANSDGIAMHPQVLGRPTGAILGLQTSLHPFSRCPAFEPLRDLPLDRKVAAMRSPELRTRLISEIGIAQQKMRESNRGFALVFPLSDDPDYEPAASASVETIAQARGVEPAEFVYDLLLEKDGRQVLLMAAGNYADGNLDPALAMLRNPHSVPGLGDAGAHAAVVCDASATTYMLSYWTRDRTRGDRVSLPEAVKWLTADCAGVLGLTDRGRLALGLKADVNIIDYGRLKLSAPRATQDLPAGGARLVQDATGYVATIVSGEVVHREDRPTDALPGRVVRRRLH